jgi:hypothetical protein
MEKKTLPHESIAFIFQAHTRTVLWTLSLPKTQLHRFPDSQVQFNLSGHSLIQLFQLIDCKQTLLLPNCQVDVRSDNLSHSAVIETLSEFNKSMLFKFMKLLPNLGYVLVTHYKIISILS